MLIANDLKIGTLVLPDQPAGGVISTASISEYSAIEIQQTTAGQTITLGAASPATQGRLLNISNTGTTSAVILGSAGQYTLMPKTSAVCVHNGSTWCLPGDAPAEIAHGTVDMGNAGGGGAPGLPLTVTSAFNVASAAVFGLATSGASGALITFTTPAPSDRYTVLISTISNSGSANDATVTTAIIDATQASFVIAVREWINTFQQVAIRFTVVHTR